MTTVAEPTAPVTTGPGDASTTGGRRRPLAYAVLLCLAGAGLALFAATRTWAVEVVSRPAPLPPIRLARTGGDLLPWLPALAVVGLAGTGAVLATRGLPRRILGGLLLLVGAAVALGAGSALLGPPTGVDPATGADLVTDPSGPAWPLLCGLGGLALAGGGAWTLARGQRWPAMGARYERGADTATPGPTRSAAVDRATGGGRARRSGGIGQPGGRDLIESWDALDRGEDPTLSDDPAPGDPELSEDPAPADDQRPD